MASPLTQYLNCIAFVNNNDDVEKIWTEVFLSDWNGDFKNLPALALTEKSRVFQHVQTRRMYEQCKETFGCRRNADTFWNMYFDDFNQDTTRVDKLTLYYFQAAAMENMWLDELQDLLKYPIALAFAAIVRGHLSLLKLLLTTYGVQPSKLSYIKTEKYDGYALDIAAHNGDLEMVRYLHATGCSTSTIHNSNAYQVGGWVTKALCKAIEVDRMDIVEYLATHHREMINENVVAVAIYRRNFSLIKMFHEVYHVECTPSAIEWALCYDTLEIAKYCFERCTTRVTTYKMNDAAGAGRLDVIQLLHENQVDGWSNVTMDLAASCGCIDVVKFLHEHRTEGCTTNAMDQAAACGYLDIVRFLHDNRTEGCTERACDAAARNRHFKVVQFLLDHGNQGFTYLAIFWAAAKGYNDILKYLLQHDQRGVYLKRALQKANRDRHRKALITLEAFTVKT